MTLPKIMCWFLEHAETKKDVLISSWKTYITTVIFLKCLFREEQRTLSIEVTAIT